MCSHLRGGNFLTLSWFLSHYNGFFLESVACFHAMEYQHWHSALVLMGEKLMAKAWQIEKQNIVWNFQKFILLITTKFKSIWGWWWGGGSRDDAADDIRDKESSLRFGDYARVARGPFEGYFAAIIEEAVDDLKIQYFKEKHGKPHGKYSILAESENEKEWRPRSDLGKIEPDIDWQGRFAFE